MIPRSMLALCFGFALVLTAAMPAQADDGPVAMSEVSRMVDADQPPEAILRVMAERGVSFRVSSAAVRRLEGWGFSDDHIALVRRIAAGEAVDLDAELAPDEPEPAGEFEVGYPNPANWHAAEQARIERAIKDAALGYQRIELTRCTLYCSDRRARQLVPMLRRLEAALIERFPESIANASSPRSAHIVIVDGDSAWRNWVTACFDSYEQDGIRYSFGGGDDPRPRMIQGSGYMLPACAVTHADKQSGDEAVARYAAFAVGYLMMQQAGGSDQPDGLRTGFGDLAEAMAHGTPSVMLVSYEDRELGQQDDWSAVVRQRFREKKITDAVRPWSYGTDSMSPAEYAECWSLVSTLAAAPDKFAAAVRTVRETDTTMGQAVRDAYGIDNDKVLEAWFRFANQ